MVKKRLADVALTRQRESINTLHAATEILHQLQSVAKSVPIERHNPDRF
jgi:hypothetical protein